MSTVYIGIGSNLGNRQDNCLKAIGILKNNGLEITAQSSMHETEPWGVKDQPKFINMALKVETDLTPQELLTLLKNIENIMGRESTSRWGPRIIDIDILLYDDMKINEDDLKIPHPLMHEREFVLEPLSEIASETIHPVLLKKAGDLLNDIKKTARILIFGVGNPLYRDDGLGNRIIDILSEKYSFPNSVRLIESGSLTDIIDFMDDYRHIIVIDTITTGKKPGEMFSFELDEMSLALNSLSHSTGFLEALKKLKDRPDIFFICIEPEDLSLGMGLSSEISEKIPAIIKMIRDRLLLYSITFQP